MMMMIMMMMMVVMVMTMSKMMLELTLARGMMANKEDWNKLVMASKVVSDPSLQDVLGFISNWCGLGGNSLNYSFK